MLVLVLVLVPVLVPVFVLVLVLVPVLVLVLVLLLVLERTSYKSSTILPSPRHEAQSCNPRPLRMRSRYFSIRSILVLDCLAAAKKSKYPRCLPGVKASNASRS